MVANNADLLAALEAERKDLVAQIKRSKGRYGEGRRLDQIDRKLIELRKEFT
jgi:hypothetical protein